MTLLELIIAIGILVILAGAALPLVHVTIQREREAELHRDLREMRNAIDRYKDDADKGLIRVAVDTEGKRNIVRRGERTMSCGHASSSLGDSHDD
jgi:general secretion pathway protein G